MKMLKKKTIRDYLDEEKTFSNKFVNELMYKYNKVLSENVALKIELRMYKMSINTDIMKNIKKDIINEDKEREKDSYKESEIFSLKEIIYKQEKEIKSLQEKYNENIETATFGSNKTPYFNNDKILNDTYKFFKLYKSFRVIQFYAIKNAVDKMSTTNDKTVDALLRLQPEEISHKGLTTDEINSFTKYYQIIVDFMNKRIKEYCDELSDTEELGNNFKEICYIINDIFGEQYISDNDIQNITNFINKIIK